MLVPNDRLLVVIGTRPFDPHYWLAHLCRCATVELTAEAGLVASISVVVAVDVASATADYGSGGTAGQSILIAHHLHLSSHRVRLLSPVLMRLQIGLV